MGRCSAVPISLLSMIFCTISSTWLILGQYLVWCTRHLFPLKRAGLLILCYSSLEVLYWLESQASKSWKSKASPSPQDSAHIGLFRSRGRWRGDLDEDCVKNSQVAAFFSPIETEAPRGVAAASTRLLRGGGLGLWWVAATGKGGGFVWWCSLFVFETEMKASAFGLLRMVLSRWVWKCKFVWTILALCSVYKSLMVGTIVQSCYPLMVRQFYYVL